MPDLKNTGCGQSLEDAVNSLKQGGVIAYPTEAVYGLGCDPQNETAVQSLLEVKQRSMDKGLILIASSLDQLSPYLQQLDQETKNRVLPTWPGPVTWLLPVRSEVPELLRGSHASIAVRITAHPLAKQLCELWGHALVSTSANVAGMQPATTAQGVLDSFGGKIDFVLEGKVGDAAKPSQIRDGHSGKIIRH